MSQDHFLREYVTKFFEAESLKYIQRGSVRFGTLDWYSAEENRLTQGARFDSEEGVFKGRYQHASSVVSNIDLPGIRADASSVVDIRGAIFSGRVNANVFCSSIGSYTTGLHKSMLLPNSNGYPGNRSLRGYVTFRTLDLLAAINAIAIRNLKALGNLDPSVRICYGPVTYGERERLVDVQSGQRGLDWDPIFTKPRFFKPENEFRIHLEIQKDARSGDVEPINLEGPEILQAMCHPPQLISEAEIAAWVR